MQIIIIIMQIIWPNLRISLCPIYSSCIVKLLSLVLATVVMMMLLIVQTNQTETWKEVAMMAWEGQPDTTGPFAPEAIRISSLVRSSMGRQNWKRHMLIISCLKKRVLIRSKQMEPQIRMIYPKKCRQVDEDVDKLMKFMVSEEERQLDRNNEEGYHPPKRGQFIDSFKNDYDNDSDDNDDDGDGGEDDDDGEMSNNDGPNILMRAPKVKFNFNITECTDKMIKVFPLRNDKTIFKRLCKGIYKLIPKMAKEMRSLQTEEEKYKLFCKLTMTSLSKDMPITYKEMMDRICNFIYQGKDGSTPSPYSLRSSSNASSIARVSLEVHVCDKMEAVLEFLYMPYVIADAISLLCYFLEKRINTFLAG